MISGDWKKVLSSDLPGVIRVIATIHPRNKTNHKAKEDRK
jgi:hypothetical protein